MTDFVDEIDKLRRTSFTVSSISVATLKKFKEFCENETGGSYALGITYLFKIYEMWDSINPTLNSIIKEIEVLKSSPKKEAKPQLKTFGDDN